MGALDVLYVKQRRTLHSRLPIEQCRQLLTYGERPQGSQLTIPSPFTTTWSNDAVARLSPAGVQQSSQIMRVQLTSEGAGAVIDATVEMNPLAFVLLLFVGVFGVFGYAETSYLLRDGTNIFEAMFPFGYLALIPLFRLLQVRFGGGAATNELLRTLEYVLGAASEYHAVPPHRVPPPATWKAPTHPVGPVPPSALPLPAEPTTAPWQPPVAARLARSRPDAPAMHIGRPFSLFTSLSIGECGRRIGPTTPNASPFGVEWTGPNEVVFRRPVLHMLNFRYELRASLLATPGGTRIDAVTRPVPDLLPALVGVLISLVGLAFYFVVRADRLPTLFVGFFPFTFLFGWWIAGAVRVALRQALTTGAVRDMVASVTDMLEAVRAVPDAGSL